MKNHGIENSNCKQLKIIKFKNLEKYLELLILFKDNNEFDAISTYNLRKMIDYLSKKLYSSHFTPSSFTLKEKDKMSFLAKSEEGSIKSLEFIGCIAGLAIDIYLTPIGREKIDQIQRLFADIRLFIKGDLVEMRFGHEELETWLFWVNFFTNGNQFDNDSKKTIAQFCENNKFTVSS